MTARDQARPGDINWPLLTLMLVLLGIGLIMLTSASISIAEDNTGRPFFYLTQQSIAVVVGLLAALVILNTPTDYWEKLGSVMLVGAVILLALVLVPGIGREVNGATRWLSIAGVNLQVSEPARLMVLMYIAGYAVRHRQDLGDSFIEMARPMAVVCVVCGLLLAEPDFGRAECRGMRLFITEFKHTPPARHSFFSPVSF